MCVCVCVCVCVCSTAKHEWLLRNNLNYFVFCAVYNPQSIGKNLSLSAGFRFLIPLEINALGGKFIFAVGIISFNFQVC